MKMRMSIGAGLAAVVAAGCVTPAMDGTAAVQSAEKRSSYCPDPTIGCTVSNGTGVYFDEGGFAGIDTFALLITHFINDGTSVRFQGRYYDSKLNLWRMLPSAGLVEQADFKTTKNLQVKRVGEVGTEPRWTLVDPATGATVTVAGAELTELVLHLVVIDPVQNERRSYAVEFVSAVDEAAVGTVLHQYVMRWHDTDLLHAAHLYCRSAAGIEDPVVFQRGMFVNPVSGSVTRTSTTASYVTLSCRRGAIATVHAWGYPYLGPTAKAHFDAGIHMKRASYCGDESFYTVAGTHIRIADDLGIHAAVAPGDEPFIEAYWNENGATCFGVQRYPLRPFTPPECDGVPLPPCPAVKAVRASGQPFLVDAISSGP